MKETNCFEVGLLLTQIFCSQSEKKLENVKITAILFTFYHTHIFSWKKSKKRDELFNFIDGKFSTPFPFVVGRHLFAHEILSIVSFTLSLFLEINARSKNYVQHSSYKSNWKLYESCPNSFVIQSHFRWWFQATLGKMISSFLSAILVIVIHCCWVWSTKQLHWKMCTSFRYASRYIETLWKQNEYKQKITEFPFNFAI